MNINSGIQLIKQFEGLRLKAYKDSVGVPTIGYGTTRYPNGRPVTMGDACTAENAEYWLQHHVQTAIIPQLDKLLKVQVPQPAYNALVSFCYNLGIGSLAKSTLLKRINAGESMQAVATEFSKWNRAGGKVLDGLTRRRAAEAALFASKT